MTRIEAQHLAHLSALDDAYADKLGRYGYDGVVIYSGHAHLHFGDDHAGSFASFGHFLHWVPLAGTQHSWLLIRPGHRPVLQWHMPQDFWHLSTPVPDEAWVKHFDIIESNASSPPSLPPGRYALLGDVPSEQAQSMGVELNPEQLWIALDELRVRKSPYEVACLREANGLAMAGHQAARDAFEGGAAELDIQLAYLAASRQRETEVPYQNIVGRNEHAGVLHYQHYDIRPAERRYSLLVDAGHRSRGYCADITRTWSGHDSDVRFQALLEGMNALQQNLVRRIAPGVHFVDLHWQMHEQLGRLLKEQGLIDCSVEAAIEQGVTYAFCPHGLGHLLGLQVHDVGGRRGPDGTALPPPDRAPALRLTRELETGMVVTIEPGCYFIPMLLAPLRETKVAHDIHWEAIDALTSHGGIRVEDNVHVTETAYENLTPSAD
ncbi:Xaa-Pro dipeptidase [Litchfieldella xinjiangensis]|uniref:Xaa-Pro dipeptidase n=1 Tax=Litchfieldella xinjiangensis TaxID=1166948 RepID=UPI0005BDDF7C|nr:Xaa-Pro dipeptidase [Halomonas xinjiangensis]